jgi:hypothetical protein
MPYRDSPDALHARIARLEEELDEARRDLAGLRDRYTRAMAALRVIAHSKKLASALEGSKLTPADLTRLAEERPSDLPPAPRESRDPRAKPDTKTTPKKPRARKPSKKKEPTPKKKPSKRGGKPKGDGIYVLVDRKSGIDR